MSETNQASTENKKTASERLEDLEGAVAQLSGNLGQVVQGLQSIEPMAKDLLGIKEALKLLNNKLNSVLQAYNAAEPLTDEFINKHMTENNANELAALVNQSVARGLFTKVDTVNNDTFIVLNEVDPSGKVVNPRIQFMVGALQHEETRIKLNGAKVGDNIPVGTEGGSINILEAYIVSVPKAPESEAAPASAQTQEVPQAEAAPSAPEAPSADPAPAPAPEAAPQEAAQA